MTEEIKGRHAIWLEKAIAAAERDGLLQDSDLGLLSAARAAAYALDASEALPTSSKPGYAIAQLLSPYKDILLALKMTPVSRDAIAEGDELKGFLDGLGQPSYSTP
jgi:hypothetical protein